MEHIKRAGDVIGVPGWQLDLMESTEDSKKWAAQEKQDNPFDQFSFNKLSWAYSSLTVVEADMGSIGKFAADAIDSIKGTDEAERIAEICDTVSDLRYEIITIMQKIHKGMFK